MPLDPAQLAVGDNIPGRTWVIKYKLGEGGMGVVFAIYKAPGLWAAAKILRPTGADPIAVARLMNETRIVGELDNPHIVRVRDFDQLEDGTAFFIMDLLRGGTVRQLLHCSEGRLSPIAAHQIMMEAVAGLACAHKNGVVHCDLKPDNLFVHRAKHGAARVVLCDFGIARIGDGKRKLGQFGTPRYMAPEQIRMEGVSARTDVYALGLTLAELLTGYLPFGSLSTIAAIHHAHLHLDPTPLSHMLPWLPRRVDDVFLAALEKNVDNRPSLEEFSAGLADLPSSRKPVAGSSLEAFADAARQQAEHDGAGASVDGEPSPAFGRIGEEPPPLPGRTSSSTSPSQMPMTIGTPLERPLETAIANAIAQSIPGAGTSGQPIAVHLSVSHAPSAKPAISTSRALLALLVVGQAFLIVVVLGGPWTTRNMKTAPTVQDLAATYASVPPNGATPPSMGPLLPSPPEPTTADATPRADPPLPPLALGTGRPSSVAPPRPAPTLATRPPPAEAALLADSPDPPSVASRRPDVLRPPARHGAPSAQVPILYYSLDKPAPTVAPASRSARGRLGEFKTTY